MAKRKCFQDRDDFAPYFREILKKNGKGFSCPFSIKLPEPIKLRGDCFPKGTIMCRKQMDGCGLGWTGDKMHVTRKGNIEIKVSCDINETCLFTLRLVKFKKMPERD